MIIAPATEIVKRDRSGSDRFLCTDRENLVTKDGDTLSKIALQYVKKLTTAPTGARITRTEKCVLMIIADSHNDILGLCWLSMTLLATSASISPRHCRRTIEQLVKKKVLERNPMRRADNGGQTSNEYVFTALGRPPETQTLIESRRKLQRVFRVPMSGRPGRRGPSFADNHVQHQRTKSTGSPGHMRPPIELLKEPLKEKLIEYVGEPSDAQTDFSQLQSFLPASKVAKDLPAKNEKNAFNNVSLAEGAWNAACESAGAKEQRSFRFRDVGVASVSENSAGDVVLVLRSPNPELTLRGIEKNRTIVASALRSFYGRDVRLVVRDDHEEITHGH